MNNNNIYRSKKTISFMITIIMMITLFSPFLGSATALAATDPGTTTYNGQNNVFSVSNQTVKDNSDYKMWEIPKSSMSQFDYHLEKNDEIIFQIACYAHRNDNGNQYLRVYLNNESNNVFDSGNMDLGTSTEMGALSNNFLTINKTQWASFDKLIVKASADGSFEDEWTIDSLRINVFIQDTIKPVIISPTRWGVSSDYVIQANEEFIGYSTNPSAYEYIYLSERTREKSIPLALGTYNLAVRDPDNNFSNPIAVTIYDDIPPNIATTNISLPEDHAGVNIADYVSATDNVNITAYTFTALPLHGELKKNGVVLTSPYSYADLNGITYTPDPNFNGTDFMNISVADVEGNSDLSQLNINISTVNDVPSAPSSIGYSISDIFITQQRDVGWNIVTDIDGDPITYELQYYNGSSYETIYNGPSTHFSHTLSSPPASGAKYRVRAYDGQAYSGYKEGGAFKVILNSPPTIAADSANTYEDQSIDVNVTANDMDADGHNITLKSINSTTHGTASIVVGKIRFVPEEGVTGTATVNYTLTDGIDDVSATLNITVTPLHDVTFNSNGGSAVGSITDVVHGSTISKPADPAYENYDFAGWYKDSGFAELWNFMTDTITADTTLYAKWNIKKYTVSFNSGEGSAVDDILNVSHGSTIIQPADPAFEGYDFLGWYKDSGFTALWNFATDTVTADTTLYAKWSIKKYTVSFNSGEGSAVDDILNVSHGSTITQPADPTLDGYDFLGWYKDGGLVNTWNFAADTVTLNTTLYAKWSIKKYTVSFDSGEGSAVDDILNVSHGSAIAKPADPTYEGYDFLGWYKDSNFTTVWNFATDTVTENTTLYAKWNIKKYTVSFDSGEGSAVDDILNVSHGSTIAEPADPAFEGYNFLGWYKDSGLVNVWNFTTDIVTADTTLYAKWNIKKYTVSFDSGEGSAVDDILNVSHGSTIIQPVDPAFEGYNFLGWYKDSSFTTVWDFTTDIVTADTTLYAKWIIKKFTVSFDSGEGSAVSDLTNINHGGTIAKPTDPTLEGYDFLGWYKDSGFAELWNFTTDIVTADITLYAKWNIKKYTVSFDSGEGSTVDDILNVSHGSAIAKPADPNREGYAFIGWYKETGFKNVWDFVSDTVTSVTTLYAKYNEIPVAVEDTVAVNEGASVLIDVTGNDTGVALDTLTITVVSQPSNGTAEVIGDKIYYTHNGSETTSDTLTYQINDGYTDSNTTTVTVNVTPVNDRPTISNILNKTINEDMPTDISCSVGDADTPIDELNVEVTSSNQSVVADNAITVMGTGTNRTLHIVPAANANGTTMIMVTVSDGILSTEDIFMLTVEAVNDAPTMEEAAFSINENSPNTSLVGTVTASDVDTSDTLAYSITDGNVDNAFAIDNDGKIIVNNSSALNFEAKETFDLTVRVTDNGELWNEGVVTVELNDINEAPTIVNITSKVTNEDITIDIPVTVADEDTADSLTITITSSKQSVVADNAITVIGTGTNCTLHIVPAANVNGTAVITVTVSDGTLSTVDVFILTVEAVNDAPTIEDVTFSIDENSPNTSLVGTVTASDVDTSDTLSYSITDGNIDNAFAIDNDGKITVNNSSALNFEAKDTFDLTVRVTDNGAGNLWDEALITINLDDVNDAPLAQNNMVSTQEDTVYVFAISKFGYTDQDGDTVDHIVVTEVPQNGKLKLGEDVVAVNMAVSTEDISSGKLAFVPMHDAAAVSYDSFTYRVNDGSLNSVQAYTMTIDVIAQDDAPFVANPISDIFVNEDAVSTTIDLTDVFSDVDNDDSAIVKMVVSNTNTTLIDASITGNKLTLDYQQNQNGTAIITVCGTSNGLTVEDAFIVTVSGVNDAPIICYGIADQIATEDTLFEFTIPEDAFDDVDIGDTLTYTMTGSPAWLSLNESGVFSGTPSGSDVPKHSIDIQVTATDAAGLSVQTSFALTVENTNDAPVIQSQSFSIAENAEGGKAVGTVAASDEDSENYTFAFTSGNMNGEFDIDSVSGEITVAAGVLLNYEQKDCYITTVTVTDDGGLSVSALVEINITDINDAPTGADGSVETRENTEYIFGVEDFLFVDEDEDLLQSVNVLTLPENGTLELCGIPIEQNTEIVKSDIEQDKLWFIPADSENGEGYGRFIFAVSDGAAYSNGYTMNVDVIPTYDVTFMSDMGSILSVQAVCEASEIQVPAVSQRTGYTFIGWTDGEILFDIKLKEFGEILGDVVFKPVYQINKYKLTYEDFDGREITSHTVAFEQSIMHINPPVRDGYRFIGWDQDIKLMPAYDVTLHAVYESIMYHVIYTAGEGGSILGSTVQTVVHGENASLVEAVPESGYMFSGWSDGVSTQQRIDENVLGDIDVSAIFTLKYVTVAGRLTDQNNHPLANVPIEIHSEPKMTITNDDGYFSFESVELGEHELIITDFEGEPLKEIDVEIVPGDKTNIIYSSESNISVTVEQSVVNINLNLSMPEELTQIIINNGLNAQKVNKNAQTNEQYITADSKNQTNSAGEILQSEAQFEDVSTSKDNPSLQDGLWIIVGAVTVIFWALWRIAVSKKNKRTY